MAVLGRGHEEQEHVRSKLEEGSIGERKESIEVDQKCGNSW